MSCAKARFVGLTNILQMLRPLSPATDMSWRATWAATITGRQPFWRYGNWDSFGRRAAVKDGPVGGLPEEDRIKTIVLAMVAGVLVIRTVSPRYPQLTNVFKGNLVIG